MAALSRVVIVGGSLAGLRAAEGLRELGYDGALAFVGEETEPPYDRPPLSKEVLRGDWEAERTSLVRGDAFDALSLQLHLGRRAVALDAADREIRLDDDTRLPFDGLVIATGATPRTLPGAPDLPGLYTLRSLADSLALRDELEKTPRVAVVGAGFIGAEVAASCRARGLAVTLIEALPVPLEAALGRDVGSTLAEVHREQGVDVRLGVGVDAVDGSRRVERLRLSDGSTVEADVVVVGIGVRPATEWLEGSGIALDDGVVCDATCATNLPGVVAAGDVARWHSVLFDETLRIEHWSNATEQGRAAAARLLDGDAGAKPFESVPFFWSDQYDRKLQFAGRTTRADATKLVQGSLGERRFVKLYGRAGRLVGALAFNRPRHLMQARRFLREGQSFDAAVAHFES
ncbi:MAG: FAD-dependent oxidoreductase [Proteobacteria bacterium]|nr:FAD-dependent oxidoreductase [Pseudomonadota bacterium]